MKENIIKTKSFAFALRIIKLYQFLQTEKKEFILSKQLLRCGTSVGAMVRESEKSVRINISRHHRDKKTININN